MGVEGLTSAGIEEDAWVAVFVAGYSDRVRWPGTGMWHGWVPVSRGDPNLNKGGVPNLVEWFQVQDFAASDGQQGDGERHSSESP